MPDDAAQQVNVLKTLAGASGGAAASSAYIPNRRGLVYPPKILAALHAVMASCGYVQKKGRNEFQKYNYAGEANLLEVLRPAMLEAGLLLIPSGEALSPVDEFGNVYVTVHYTLAHKDGDVWPEKLTVFGAGNDKNSKGGVGDKGLYKALTGANKYLLFKLFQIETGDDPEKESAGDKDDAPARVIKSAPGISQARKWVMDEVHDLNGCSDNDELMGRTADLRARYVRICRVYPELWIGPDGSGLRGEAVKVSTVLQCSEDMKKWLASIEVEAKTPLAAE